MDDNKEAADFQKEREETKDSEDPRPKKKVKKSVGFNLDQNEIKEFEKNSRIIEGNTDGKDTIKEDIADNINKEKQKKK